MMNEEQAELIKSQLTHITDLLRSDLNLTRSNQQHESELIRHRLKELESIAKDHEQRIRNVTDGVTSYKVTSGLASGGSSIMSIIALVKAFFGA